MALANNNHQPQLCVRIQQRGVDHYSYYKITWVKLRNEDGLTYTYIYNVHKDHPGIFACNIIHKLTNSYIRVHSGLNGCFDAGMCVQKGCKRIQIHYLNMNK